VTTRVSACAIGVFADAVNAGVWFPPFGSVGMAAQHMLTVAPETNIISKYHIWDEWKVQLWGFGQGSKSFEGLHKGHIP
jgi:hypothetical protein